VLVVLAASTTPLLTAGARVRRPAAARRTAAARGRRPDDGGSLLGDYRGEAGGQGVVVDRAVVAPGDVTVLVDDDRRHGEA